jgi:hypothetical protein
MDIPRTVCPYLVIPSLHPINYWIGFDLYNLFRLRLFYFDFAGFYNEPD